MKNWMKRQDKLFFLILLLALFLYGWGIWSATSANSYYTAAITSMVQSWSNFFYGAFDPAGFITVDKPPVALWFMAISAKIFGVHGWSVVLPSVLFGVGSVALLYHMVKPRFGVVAARLSALGLTLTPIVVANSRTNNMDATLLFFLLLATYFLFKAVRIRKPWMVFLAFFLIGVSFNIKMLQAFMILPAMYLFYWLTAHISIKKKIVHTVIATVFLAVSTLTYPLIVDSTSSSSRPYIGSSQTNSLMELAFGYNGTERLLGQSTGTGGTFAGMNSKTSSKKQTQNGMPSMGKQSSKKSSTKGGFPGGGQAPTGKKASGKNQTMGTPPNGTGKGNRRGGGGMNGAGGAFDIGTAGPFRLFQSSLGPQISWLLPFALGSLIVAFAAARKRKQKWYQTTEQQKELVYWATWLAAVGGFFSIASFFHPYYMIMLAPPIAVLFGIGAAHFVQMRKQEVELKQWHKVVLTLGAAISIGLQAWYVSSYYMWATILLLIVGLGLLALLWVPGLSAARQRFVRKVFIVVLLLAPGFWALTPTLARESAAIPTSGPSLLSSTGNAAGGLGSESVNTGLLKYLEKHQGTAKYLFVTTDSNSASPYIIKSGKAVMAIGGYNGTDPAITLKQFKKLVASGDIKYFYSSGKNTSSSIAKWVAKVGTKISASDYSSSSTSSSSKTNQQTGPGGGMGGMNSGTLYRLDASSVQ